MVQPHAIMAYIAACWSNFGKDKTPAQKRTMIAVWEQSLADIPLALQKRAIDLKVRQGQVFPPSSPAELRQWCCAVQKPMDGIDAAFYRTCQSEGLLDGDFCQRQIDKFASGATAFAG